MVVSQIATPFRQCGAFSCSSALPLSQLFRMPARCKSTTHFCFKATAMRDSIMQTCEANLWSLSAAKENLWLAFDSLKGEREGTNQNKAENIFWVPHFIHHLAPQGMAGFVLANGSMSSNQSGDCPARSASSKPKAKPQSLQRQHDIRRALIGADLVDSMVALRDQLFHDTQNPVCLWFSEKRNTAWSCAAKYRMPTHHLN